MTVGNLNLHGMNNNGYLANLYSESTFTSLFEFIDFKFDWIIQVIKA